MSLARLRVLPPAPATAPDLLLRTFEPPPVLVRGQDLPALLTPAYHRLAGDEETIDAGDGGTIGAGSEGTIGASGEETIGAGGDGTISG
jgi:hypothetical protein